MIFTIILEGWAAVQGSGRGWSARHRDHAAAGEDNPRRDHDPLHVYLGKAELLDLMLDTVYRRMPRTDTTGEPWRRRLDALAEDHRRLYEHHPRAATIATSRPALWPGLMAKYDNELRALDDTGLDDVDKGAALAFLLDFVRASACAAVEVEATRRESRMSDEQWKAANIPLLAGVVDATDPTPARVGTAAGAAYHGAYSPHHVFRLGLERVLDGLGVMIDRHGR